MKTKGQRTLHARCNELMNYSGHAGHLLAELCYFWQIAKWTKDSKFWVVGTTEEFEKRFGITRNQYKTAIKKLKDRDYIEVRTGVHPYKVGKLRVTWVTIPPSIAKKFGLKSPVPSQAKKVLHKLAENKPTKKVVNKPTLIYGEEKLLEHPKKVESGSGETEFQGKASGEDKWELLEKFEQIWKETYAQYGHGHSQSWKKSEVKKFALPIMEEANWDLAKVEKAITASFPLEKWKQFCTRVQEAKGWEDHIPNKPSIAFVRQVVGLWFDYSTGAFESKYKKYQVKNTYDCL